MRERNQVVDALKGLSILGVLFAHARFTGRFSSGALDLVAFLQVAFQWCVLGFFFCAGLLAGSPPAGWGEWARLALRRAARLLVPCVIFSVTYRLLLLALSSAGRSSARVAVPGTAAEAARFVLEPVDPQFYFLPYLFVIAAGSGLLAVALRPAGAAVVGLLAGSGATLAFPPGGRVYGPDHRLLGLYAAAYVASVVLATQPPRRGWLAATVFTVAALLAAGTSGNPNLAAAPAPVLAYLAWRRLPVPTALGGLGYLGRKSGAVYVWHAPILMPSLSIAAAAVLPNSFAALAATVSSCVVVCVLLGRLTERFAVLRPYRF